MKRKEAIELIGKILVFGIQGNEKVDRYKGMSLADIILTELEEVGMLPPDTGKNYQFDVWHGPEHKWED
jgi:hypothetical protein